MYAISEGTRRINDIQVNTFSRKVRHVNCDLDVEAGTTGLRGYIPREKSSRSYVSVGCSQGDFLFESVTDRKGRVVGFEIACCGDSSLMALTDALEFAVKALKDGY